MAWCTGLGKMLDLTDGFRRVGRFVDVSVRSVQGEVRCPLSLCFFFFFLSCQDFRQLLRGANVTLCDVEWGLTPAVILYTWETDTHRSDIYPRPRAAAERMFGSMKHSAKSGPSVLAFETASHSYS